MGTEIRKIPDSEEDPSKEFLANISGDNDGRIMEKECS